MGVVADAVLAGDGEVVGVIPESLMQNDVVHRSLTRLEVVASMHARKRRMIELSDALVALPGGLGTLDELFEALTWAQLQFHHKPCGLLNVRGYFNGLLGFLDGAVEQGFLSQQHRCLPLVESDPDQLIEMVLQQI